MRLILSMAAAAICAASVAPAHADLVPGDVVILGFNADAPDAFAWAPLVDLAAGTQISFTDNGVLSDGSIRANEETAVYTAPAGGILAGTILTFTNGSAGSEYSGALSGLSASGDQVLAYVGTESDPTYIFIAQSNSSQFQTGSINSNSSTLPTDLVEGQTAVAAGRDVGAEDEYDNIVYDYSLTTGTREEILAAVADQDNWIGDNTRITSLTGGFSSFTVLAAVPEPSGFLFGSLVAGVASATVGRRRKRA